MKLTLVLPLLVPLFVPFALAQEPEVTPIDLTAEIQALGADDPTQVATACQALVAQAELAIPMLQEKYKSLAQEPSAKTFPHMLEIMHTLGAMGPKATPAIAFMADCTSFLNMEVMEKWREDKTGDSVRAFNSLWDSMRVSIGATGEPGLRMIMEKTKAKERTENGVPFGAIMNTILPNGTDSMRAIATFAFSEEDFERNAAVHFARYAADDLGVHLKEKLESDQEKETDRCLMLMHCNIPHSLPTLCGLLQSPKESLRRGALNAMLSLANGHLLDPKSGEYRSYEDLHGHLHPTRTRPFEAVEGLRDQQTTDAVAQALKSEDEVTRILAAFLLCRVAQPGAKVSEPLLAAAKDPSPAVKYWAIEAIQRREAVDARWIAAMNKLSTDHRWEGIEGFSERKQAAKEALLADAESFAALERAEDCAEAIVRLEALVEVVHGDWPVKGGYLGTLESIRHRDMWWIAEELDNGGFGQGMGHDGMRRFGAAAYPEFEADYLKEPRFSVGGVTYSERAEFVKSLGKTAIPLATQALFHWREEARNDFSKAGLKDIGADAAVAVTILQQAEAWYGKL